MPRGVSSMLALIGMHVHACASEHTLMNWSNQPPWTYIEGYDGKPEENSYSSGFHLENSPGRHLVTLIS